jgi:NhaA family Na+:H+ antiporter
VRPAHILGMAAAAGTGFTVSLFVAEVVFGATSPLLPPVKIALLVASLLSGLLGWTVLRLVPATPADPSDGADER